MPYVTPVKAKHTKLYMDFFGYGIEDFIPSEISGNRTNDIHHINAKGMGGSSKADHIENLMAVTREEHELYGDISDLKEKLFAIHKRFIQINKPDYKFEYL